MAYPAASANAMAAGRRRARPAASSAAAHAPDHPMDMPMLGIAHHSAAGDRATAAPVNDASPTRRVSESTTAYTPRNGAVSTSHHSKAKARSTSKTK